MNRTIIIGTIILSFIGCGGGSSKTSYDMADYLPNSDTSKNFLTTKDNGNRSLYREDISINGNKIKVKIDNRVVREYTINETTILENDIENNLTKVLKKSINKGDTLYSLPKTSKIEEIKFENTVLGTKSINSTTTCKLEDKLDKFNDYTEFIYEDDILKFKCIEDKKIVTHIVDNLPDYINLTNGEEISDYDISYFYMKKGVGLIAEINDDCIIKNSNGVTRINDSATECDEEHYSHTFFLE